MITLCAKNVILSDKGLDSTCDVIHVMTYNDAFTPNNDTEIDLIEDLFISSY